MFTNLHIQNLKACRNTTLDLSRLQVFIGPNDSGKSTILQALYALGTAISRNPDDQPLGPFESADQLFFDPRDPTISIRADLRAEDGVQDEFAIDWTLKSVPPGWSISAEARRIGEKIYTLSRHFSAEPHGVFAKPLSTGKASEGSSETIFRAVGNVRLHRFSVRDMKSFCEDGASWQLASDGGNLALTLDHLVRNERSRFEKIQTELHEFFKFVREINIPKKHFPSQSPGHSETRLGLSIRTDNGRVIPASQMSDGFLLVLAILTAVHAHGDEPATIMIEEPENGLHPSRIDEVARALRSIVDSVPSLQLIITTHSPLLLDAFQPQEVSVVHRDEEGVTVTRVQDSEDMRRQLSILSLGEIWLNGGETRLAGR